ncbi:MAG: hypothetical protein IJE61_04665 [Bacteroidales bacterium]|nr:hypothetical protein [Bacteroidales bacterium]
MRNSFFLFALVVLAAVSCGPSRHAIHVEMRYPSRSGLDLAGKIVSVVYLENENPYANTFNESMADGFAYALEQDYGTGEGSVGIYRMMQPKDTAYATREYMFNLLMDTGSDMVFLFDTLSLGPMVVGGPSRVAVPVSPDSAYVSSGSMQFTMKLYCFDAMDKDEEVHVFTGTSTARPDVYSNGNESSTMMIRRAYEGLPVEGWDAGTTVASSFKSQWKHEQYSLTYFDSDRWYKPLELAEQYDWKGALDKWIVLLDSNDLLRRSCAEYNIAVACYMMGEYELASEWLDRSDKDNKLPLSDGLRKRIDSRK